MDALVLLQLSQPCLVTQPRKLYRRITIINKILIAYASLETADLDSFR